MNLFGNHSSHLFSQSFRRAFFLLLLSGLGIGAFATDSSQVADIKPKDFTGIKQVLATIETHEGNIVVDLNFKESPITVTNFINLANKKFYDGLTFHRVIQGFMTQGGCPKGDGTGGAGYAIKDEPNKLKHEAGVISMANSGPNSGSSQFFITHMPQPHLDGRHTVFGKVISGFPAVTRIEKGDPMISVKIQEIR